MSKDPRRPLHFRSLEEVRAEVDCLAALQRQGRLVAAGQWTTAQIVEHISKLMEMSLDGFPFNAPLPLRIFGRLIRPFVVGKPCPRGIQLKGESAKLLPSDDAELDAAVARLGRSIDRVVGGARMEAPSPIFGPLTHEQWFAMHLRHAEHHLGFLRPQA